jgi:type I site-specific restriction-modification system R (restriction) subunit
MIKAAEMLFKAPQADKPTVLMMIDRNELEDQMLKNLAAEEDDLDKVTGLVDSIFTVLQKASAT